MLGMNYVSKFCKGVNNLSGHSQIGTVIFIVAFIIFIFMKNYERDFLKRHFYGSYFKNISKLRYRFFKLVSIFTLIIISCLLWISVDAESWLVCIALILIGVFIVYITFNLLFYPHCYKRDILPAYENLGKTYVILNMNRKRALISPLTVDNFINYKKAKKYFGNKFTHNLIKDIGRKTDISNSSKNINTNSIKLDNVNGQNVDINNLAFIGLFNYNKIFIKDYKYIYNISKNNGIFYIRNYQHEYIKYLKNYPKKVSKKK